MLNRKGLEDSYGRCRSEKLRQTVPDASSGDRKSSVTDSRESGAADDQWWGWTGTVHSRGKYYYFLET